MRKQLFKLGDLFCGCGGMATGGVRALDARQIAHEGWAINHWPRAVQTMQSNHPHVHVMEMDLTTVIPSEVIPCRHLDHLHASPSCTHHSRAKGGRPRSNQLRAQPNLVLDWLDDIDVSFLSIENVPEFMEWGPLDYYGRPIERLKGANFKAWVHSIEARNYTVEWQVVNCADYGDATSRQRFFLKAVKRGRGKIHWPQPTHAEHPETDLWGFTPQPWRGARECLDLNDIGTSIFNRSRPLAANTLRRIAVGMEKYNGMDFLMDLLDPAGKDNCRLRSLDTPLFAQPTWNRTALVRPFIVKLNNHADAENVEKPLTSVLAGGQHHALCQPVIIDHFKNGEAHSVDEPLGAQTTHDRFSLVSPVIFDEAVGLPRLPDGRYIDIPLRMLKPSELAAAHSFPKDYVITGNRGEQVKQIGNSVPVRTAEAMMAADLESVAA